MSQNYYYIIVFSNEHLRNPHTTSLEFSNWTSKLNQFKIKNQRLDQLASHPRGPPKGSLAAGVKGWGRLTPPELWLHASYTYNTLPYLTIGVLSIYT